MGVRLHRCDAYKIKSFAGEKIYRKGQEVFGLSPEEEKYLLSLGYFHYVPEPGQTTPKEIALADKNINGRLAGVLDGQGKPINKAKEPVEIPETDAEELRVDLDEKGKPVFTKPGASCLDQGKTEAEGVEQFVKPAKSAKGARKLKVS